MKATRNNRNIFGSLFYSFAALVAVAAVALWAWPDLEAMIYARPPVDVAIAPPPFSFLLFLAFLAIVFVGVFYALRWASARAGRPLYRARVELRLLIQEHRVNMARAEVAYHERGLHETRMELDLAIGKKQSIARELNRLNVADIRDAAPRRLPS